MTTPIGPFQKLPLSVPPLSAQPGDAARGGDFQFQNLLMDSLKQTASSEQTAQAAIEQNLTGGDITQVEVFSAVKKADLALRTMMQIRNKLLEAYNEVKQMQM